MMRFQWIKPSELKLEDAGAEMVLADPRKPILGKLERYANVWGIAPDAGAAWLPICPSEDVAVLREVSDAEG